MVKPPAANSFCKTTTRTLWIYNARQRMTTPVSDETKAKLVRGLLAYLLHAHLCQKLDATQQHRQECRFPRCRGMKNVLRHMANCSSGRTCQFAYCYSFRRILLHFKHCLNSSCRVCEPLKRFSRIRNTLHTFLLTNPTQNTISSLTSQPNGFEVSAAVSQTQITQNQQADEIHDDLSTHNIDEVLPLLMEDSGSGGTYNSVNVEFNPQPGTSRQNFETSSILDYQVPGTSNMTPPIDMMRNEEENCSNSKEWHNDIGSEFREILINEFVRKLLVNFGPEIIAKNLEKFQTTIDERFKSSVKNAENDIYQKADSRMEYYDLLAEKYFKIQCELQKGNLAALEM